MKLDKMFTETFVATWEEAASTQNRNMERIAKHLTKLYKKNKRATILSLVAIAGTLYLAKSQKKSNDKIDRLEEHYKNLYEDYHNYVISHSEYNPDKDDDLFEDL